MILSSPKIKSFIIKDAFHDKYSRNNRTTGQKSLRCFPCCNDKGHIIGGFCGKHIDAQLTFDGVPMVIDDLILVMEIHPTSSSGKILSNSSQRDADGLEISAQSLNSLQTDLFYGEVVSFLTLDSPSTFRIQFNNKLHSWDYSWKSNRWLQEVHIAHAFVLRRKINNFGEPSGDYYSIIGSCCSSEFSISSCHKKPVLASRSDIAPLIKRESGSNKTDGGEDEVTDNPNLDPNICGPIIKKKYRPRSTSTGGRSGGASPSGEEGNTDTDVNSSSEDLSGIKIESDPTKHHLSMAPPASVSALASAPAAKKPRKKRETPSPRNNGNGRSIPTGLDYLLSAGSFAMSQPIPMMQMHMHPSCVNDGHSWQAYNNSAIRQSSNGPSPLFAPINPTKAATVLDETQLSQVLFFQGIGRVAMDPFAHQERDLRGRVHMTACTSTAQPHEKTANGQDDNDEIHEMSQALMSFAHASKYSFDRNSNTNYNIISSVCKSPSEEKEALPPRAASVAVTCVSPPSSTTEGTGVYDHGNRWPGFATEEISFLQKNTNFI